MGNSFSSKKKNKGLNLKKKPNNLKSKNLVSNSATGRHSVGLFNKENNVKSKSEKNDIFALIKNQNQLRENLRTSINIKTVFNETSDPRSNKNSKGFYFEFYLDYKKIFFEVFSSSHKNKVFKQIEDLDSEIDNEENYYNENIVTGNEKESDHDLDYKNNNNIKRNYFMEKLDFSHNLNRKYSKVREPEVYKQDMKHVKSFITALSKENTEDFLVGQKKNKINDDQQEIEKIPINKDSNNICFQVNLNEKQRDIIIICNDKDCLYFSKRYENEINENREISNKERMEDDDYMMYDNNLKYNYIRLKNEIKKKELDKIQVDNKEEIHSFKNKKIKQKNFNLGLEEIQDLEAEKTFNFFDNNSNDIKCEAVNEEQSTINFISNIGTPNKKKDGTNDFQFTEEKDTKNNLNLNSLVKLITKASYFESPKSKNFLEFDESNEFKKIEKEVEQFNSDNSQSSNEPENKSTVSFSEVISKDFICADCLYKINLSNSKHKIKKGKEEKKEVKLKFQENRKTKNNNNYIYDSEKDLQKSFKSSNNIRNNYITRLICNNVWLPNSKPKNHNSIIIFDWDDTLLCTSFLTPNGIFYDNLQIEKCDLDKITKLESLTYNILNSAIEKGDTFIVTNAAPGWVEYSAKRFYPKVIPLLSKINIISARGEFEKKHPGNSRQWKIQTFLNMVKIMDTKLVTNLICLGDSLIEMEAAHIMASKFPQVYIKTVKFRENPLPEELFKQIKLILDQFNHIFSAVKNLTIKVERKNKNPFNNKTNYTSFENLTNFDISQIRNTMPNQPPHGLKSAEKAKNN